MELGELQDKIEILSKIENDECEYIVKVYHYLTRFEKKYKEYDINNDTSNFLILDNLDLANEKINSIYKKQNLMIICFDENNDIDKIKEGILGTMPDAIYFVINAHSTNIEKYWYTTMRRKLYSIMSSLSKISCGELEKDPINIATEIVGLSLDSTAERSRPSPTK